MAPNTGWRTFITVWVGQAVSVVGTGLTGFALAIWVYQKTGSTTQLSFVLLATAAPPIFFGPVAGALVDRWDRRIAMIISDTGAGLGTLVLATLFLTGTLEVWHLYPILAVSAAFSSFQFPAYSAATTLLVPKEDYGRAAGMVQLAEAVGQIASPVIAGLILGIAGLGAVIATDVVTFLFAVGTLLVVRFPRPPSTEAGDKAKGGLITEAIYGFRYLLDRRGLVFLLAFSSVLNLVFGYVLVFIYPLILSFASETAMGAAFSLAGIGALVGGLVMSTWGGPKRKMSGVYGGMVVLSLSFVVAALRPSLPLVIAGLFLAFLVLPVVNGSSQALWLAKVHPDVQGRVFSVRRAVASAMTPIAFVTAGPIGDRLLEPTMEPGGIGARLFGDLIGTGPGRGFALGFVLIGTASLLITIAAYLYAPLRNLERDLPDAIPDEPAEASRDAHTP